MSSGKKLIQASAGVVGGDFYPYTVENSLRFDGASYLSRTFGTATSRKKFTFSVWLKQTNLAQTLPVIFSAVGIAGSWEEYIGTYYNALRLYNGSSGVSIVDSALKRDPSAMYHLHIKVDTTQGTAADRMIMSVNGTPITLAASSYPALNADMQINNAVQHRLGYFVAIAGAYYFNGYMAECVFVDGTAYDTSSFGEDNNGTWIPKDPSGLTFGSNGFYLDFKDGTSATTLGYDVSGNGNHFTASGIATTDQMIDTPTNNFCTINPLNYDPTTPPTFSEGNQTAIHNASLAWRSLSGNMAFPNTGKWYFEYNVTGTANNHGVGLGIARNNLTDDPPSGAAIVGYLATAGHWPGFQYWSGSGGVLDNTSGTYTHINTAPWNAGWTTQTIGVAVDMDAGTVDFYKNNTLVGTYTPSGTFPGDEKWVPVFATYDGSQNCNLNFGANAFAYTPPTDHLALCTANLPEPTLGPNSAENVTDHFNTVLYTGNGTAIGSGGKAVTGVGFQSDFTWIKNRDTTDNYRLFDAARGVTKYLQATGVPNFAEVTDTESLSTFDSDGFTLGNEVGVNTNTEDYVSWNWKVATSGSSNTEGSKTSTVYVNDTAGISIALCDIGASGNITFGHGLSSAPDLVIGKTIGTAGSWSMVLPAFMTKDDYIFLNRTDALASYTDLWGSALPTSTVVGVQAGIAFSNDTLFYSFVETPGFSKFGEYTGNGNANGPYIHAGFRPAVVMIKHKDGVASWYIHDTSRSVSNLATERLYLGGVYAEYSGGGYGIDILSNGFKVRTTDNGWNTNGGDYTFLAFAEMPFKYSNAR